MNTATTRLTDETMAFQRSRQETMQLVEGLSQQDFDWCPAEDKWSIGEVLDHILLAELFFQRDLKRFAQSSRAGQPIRIRHTLRDLDIGLPFVPTSLMPALELPLSLATLFVPPAMLNFLTSSRIFPMRHPTVASPQRGRVAIELRQDLSRACERTVGILEQLSASNASTMTVSHPLLGRRNVPELIRFMIEHERRHQGQIADLKTDLGSFSTPKRSGF